MAHEMGVTFLGRIPIDPAVGEACDAGKPFVYHYSRTETAKALNELLRPCCCCRNGLQMGQQ